MSNSQAFSQSLACLLTPHDIAIAILIDAQLTHPTLSPALRNELSLYLIEVIESDEAKLYQFISENSTSKIGSFCSLKSFCHHVIMNDFQSQDKSILAETVFQTMSQIRVPDDLFDLFIRFRNVLTNETSKQVNASNVPQRAHLSSIYGIFMRKLVLAFQQLMFDGVCHLFENVEQFVVEQFDDNDDDIHGDSLMVLDHPETTHIQDVVLSNVFHSLNPITAEKYVYDLIQRLESSNIDMKTDYEELNRIANHLGVAFPSITKIYYLKYLLFVQQREWEGAIENLHRYFDYCYCDNSVGLVLNQAQTSTNINSMIASYATLNLAALHYQFGHYGAALQSIQESIRIAQQQNEHECLALALAWLFRLADIKGFVDKTESLIKRCIQRAKELQMNDLLSQSLLAYTKLSMLKLPYTPDYIRRIWDDIATSLKIDIENNIPFLSQTSLLMQASVWENLGNKSMVTMLSKLVTDDSSPIRRDDYILAHCKLAQAEAKEGRVKESLFKLQSIYECVHEQYDSLYTQTICNILFDYFCLSHHIEDARALLEMLNDLRDSHSVDGMDNVQYRSDLLDKRAKLMLCESRYQEASELLLSSIDISKGTNLHLAHLKHLLALVDIYISTPNTVVNAIKYAAQGMAISRQRGLETYYSNFSVYMAHALMLTSSEYLKAQKLIDSAASQLVCHGSALDLGYLYFVRGKLFVLRAKSPGQNSDPRSLISQALESFSLAKAEYQRVHAIGKQMQVLFLEAQTLNAAGMIKQRDEISQQFVQLSQQRKSRTCTRQCDFSNFYGHIGPWIRTFLGVDYQQSQ